MNTIQKTNESLIAHFEWVIIKDSDRYVAVLPSLNLTCNSKDKYKLEDILNMLLIRHFNYYKSMEKLNSYFTNINWKLVDSTYTYSYNNSTSIKEFLEKKYNFDINIIETNTIIFNYKY